MRESVRKQYSIELFITKVLRITTLKLNKSDREK